MTKCPESLPEPTITESQWKALLPADQWEYVKINIGAPWSTEYHICALRHNTFVDWYLENGTLTE